MDDRPAVSQPPAIVAPAAPPPPQHPTSHPTGLQLPVPAPAPVSPHPTSHPTHTIPPHPHPHTHIPPTPHPTRPQLPGGERRVPGGRADDGCGGHAVGAGPGPGAARGQARGPGRPARRDVRAQPAGKRECVCARVGVEWVREREGGHSLWGASSAHRLVTKFGRAGLPWPGCQHQVGGESGAPLGAVKCRRHAVVHAGDLALPPPASASPILQVLQRMLGEQYM